jgi:CDGSH-type Zn-finger protein/uncharacterized Fe-S cluster protein YjdI
VNETKITRYPGRDVEIAWDERLCIHIGECGRAAGELFVGGRKPWCDPDLATAEEVRDVVERCPSGALTYAFKDGSMAEAPAADNTVVVTYNGPLFVRGDLAIEGAPADLPGVRYRAALCRCGKSAHKPFCDNSHAGAAFTDYGAVGETGDGTPSQGGTLTIKVAKDGPLLFNGAFTIVASSGRTAWWGDKAALCRCGASKNKPFCDGSHKTVGFRSD